MAIPRLPQTESNFLKGGSARTEKSPRKAYPMRLRGELYEWLQEFSAARDQTMAEIIRSALREYRDKHETTSV